MRTRVKCACLLGSVLGLLIVGCGDHKAANNDTQPSEAKSQQVWNRSSAESEYRLLQAEMKLAKSDSVYLVLDFKTNRIELKLENAVVWSHRFDSTSNGMEEADDFCKRFQAGDGRLVRPIVEKYLFEASNKTPDSLLAIVSGAVSVNPELLQRHVPERFQIVFGEGLIIDIHSDVTGEPLDKFQNTMMDIRQTLRRPLGDVMISLKLDPDESITLFRATDPGMPALLIPAR